MHLLNVGTTAMLAQNAGAVKILAVSLPQPHHRAAVTHNQGEVVGVDVTGFVRGHPSPYPLGHTGWLSADIFSAGIKIALIGNLITTIKMCLTALVC